jgi:hypothetical protein
MTYQCLLCKSTDRVYANVTHVAHNCIIGENICTHEHEAHLLHVYHTNELNSLHVSHILHWVHNTVMCITSRFDVTVVSCIIVINNYTIIETVNMHVDIV